MNFTYRLILCENLQREYWDAKWKILNNIWDDAPLEEMYKEYKITKWNNMQWTIYYQYHKEEIKQRKKERYEQNKEEIDMKSKEYRDKHKDEIKERRQHHIEQNREEFNKTRRKYVQSVTIKCECGSTYRNVPSKRNSHLQSNKHKTFEQSKT